MAATGAGALDGARLMAQVDELAAELAALPEESFTRRARPEDWTAAEVTGHLTEMMPYWAGVVTAVAARPGSAFGRAEDDPDRLGAVRAANAISRGEALTRLRQAAHTAALAFSAQSDADRDATGVHPQHGAMTVAAVIEMTVLSHLESHTRQALEAAGVTPADPAS